MLYAHALDSTRSSTPGMEPGVDSRDPTVMPGWTLRRADGSESALDVPKRSREQRDRAKQNFENPPPPENRKRHGQLESLR